MATEGRVGRQPGLPLSPLTILVFAVREICYCGNTAAAAEGEGENVLAHVEMKGH